MRNMNDNVSTVRLGAPGFFGGYMRGMYSVIVFESLPQKMNCLCLFAGHVICWCNNTDRILFLFLYFNTMFLVLSAQLLVGNFVA
jgi:hypothetical protein